MPTEPTENISGGPAGGARSDSFDRAENPATAERVIDRLGELYWEKTYGGQDAFVCLVRTILSQNTTDATSQPAHDALIERYEGPESDLARTLAAADHDELAETIAPAGLQHQKATSIIQAAERITEEFDNATEFDRFVRDTTTATVRETLLEFHGVGPKTADCVLLFAGGQSGVFPVDTHVHRIYRRLGVAPPDADHETVRESLEATIPPKKCGFGHTASIQFGREYCTARQPVCVDDPSACPLFDLCDRVGVETD
ncbi:endonuclease III domain-containing protein [Halocatena halophila]|uniref:endonuclease III domain-containing protein n=1 Tax=Halocatena halophila TaxID=2814576 RepID=UPI002ED547A5